MWIARGMYGDDEVPCSRNFHVAGGRARNTRVVMRLSHQ